MQYVNNVYGRCSSCCYLNAGKWQSFWEVQNAYNSNLLYNYNPKPDGSFVHPGLERLYTGRQLTRCWQYVKCLTFSGIKFWHLECVYLVNIDSKVNSFFTPTWSLIPLKWGICCCSLHCGPREAVGFQVPTHLSAGAIQPVGVKVLLSFTGFPTTNTANWD